MRLTIVLLLALVAPSVPAAAQSDPRLRDYLHTVWTQHDGMPLGRVTTILQTSDGYLWVLAREHGLLRFDGMRFVSPATPCKEQVTSASGAPDGGLWVLCGGQLVRRTAVGQFVEVPQAFLPKRAAAGWWLLVDRLGRGWHLGASVRSIEPDGTGFRDTRRPTAGPIRAAAMESDGTLWVSDTRQVMRLDGGQQETFALAPVWCLVRARNGGVFAVTPERVWRLGKGSQQLAMDEGGEVRLSGADDCVSEAADGGLWIGTRQHGVGFLQDGRFETLPDADKLGRAVDAVFIDREETVWVGASTGLHRFRKPSIQSLPSQERYLGGPPAFAFVDSQDHIWISPAPNDGVSRVNPKSGAFTLVASQGHPYWAIGEDAAGRIWLSDTRNIGYVANGAFVPVRDVANAAVEEVASFKQDSRGQLWAIAAGAGVYRVAPGIPRLEIKSPRASQDFLMSDRLGTWVSLSSGGVEQHLDGRTYAFPDDQPERIDSLVRTIMDDGDSIWITTRRGLRRWRHGIWTTWTRDHGLPGTGSTEEILVDRLGHFWLMTTRGLLRLPRAQLDATPDGVPRMLSFARIGVTEGVAPLGGGAASSPRALVDRHGRLHIATLDSVVTIDPSAVIPSSMAPPIVLESATIDHQAVDLTRTQSFVEPSLLQFDYTSLSLRSPELARFRYRLDGYDTEWTEAGSRRHVTYGVLRPGSYRFRVIGAGAEGVWNETGASFAFQITPVFWRTWWFRATLLGIASLVVAALYRLRVRQLTRQFNIGVEARVGERTRVARELHDTLLQTVQGSKMVADEALKNAADHRLVVRALEQLSTWLAQATEEGRAAVNSLRASSTETDDLAQSVRQAIDECRPTSRAEISMAVNGESKAIHPVVRDEVYRIAYEAIRNACTHSGGDRIDVSLVYGNDLTVRINDNGSGIEPRLIETGREGHFGLRGMQERAERIGGKLTIVGPSGLGSSVTLVVPGRTAASGS